MHYPLKGKVVAITGASKGLGKALAFAFAKEGSIVSISGLEQKSVQDVCNTISKESGICTARITDVTKKTDVEAFIRSTLKIHKKIDIFINNAGWISTAKPVEEITDDEYETYMRTNTHSVFYALRAVLPVMKGQKEGIVITIGSGAGRVPHPLLPVYSATKFAIHSLMRATAKRTDLQGIRLLTIAPGGINTDMRRKLFGEEDSARQQSAETVATLICGIIQENTFATGDEIEIRNGAITARDPMN